MKDIYRGFELSQMPGGGTEAVRMSYDEAHEGLRFTAERESIVLDMIDMWWETQNGSPA